MSVVCLADHLLDIPGSLELAVAAVGKYETHLPATIACSPGMADIRT